MLKVFRRVPALVDRTARGRVLTVVSMLGPPLVRPTGVEGIAPEIATVAVSAAGLLLVIAGKLSLGRSFGLMPANRGIVSTGLYRLVRHPIYLGYLITHYAFVAANASMWNMILLVTADLALMVRTVCEEWVLARLLQSHQQIVRWRIQACLSIRFHPFNRRSQPGQVGDGSRDSLLLPGVPADAAAYRPTVILAAGLSPCSRTAGGSSGRADMWTSGRVLLSDT